MGEGIGHQNTGKYLPGGGGKAASSEGPPGLPLPWQSSSLQQGISPSFPWASLGRLREWEATHLLSFGRGLLFVLFSRDCWGTLAGLKQP